MRGVARPSCVRVRALLERRDQPGGQTVGRARPATTADFKLLSSFFLTRAMTLWRCDQHSVRQWPSMASSVEIMDIRGWLRWWFVIALCLLLPTQFPSSHWSIRAGGQQVVFLLHSDYWEGKYYKVFLTFQYERSQFSPSLLIKLPTSFPLWSLWSWLKNLLLKKQSE